jgi:hypothetical protein
VRIPLAAAALMSAGCTAPPQSTPPPPEHAACNVAAAQGLIGRRNSPALAQEAQRRTGAGAVRVLRPGQMVTMEYRADRLNIRVDTQGKVLAVSCG